MNDIQRLKYDLSLRYASIMIQNAIASGDIKTNEITKIRNNMISHATDFAELLNSNTMDESVLPDLLELFTC